MTVEVREKCLCGGEFSISVDSTAPSVALLEASRYCADWRRSHHHQLLSDEGPGEDSEPSAPVPYIPMPHEKGKR